MAGLLASLAGMQFLSAVVSEPKKEMDAYQNAKDICDQLPIVQGQIDAVVDLRTQISSATQELQADTEAKIVALNTGIKARINSIKEMQTKFKMRVLITVITNILLISVIGFFLFV